MRLVEACVKQDLAAWSVFVKKYGDLISISIKNRLKNYNISVSRQDIEDIRQEILASIWKDNKLESVRNRANIAYWLAILSGNTALEHIRKRRSYEPEKLVPLSSSVNEKELADIVLSDTRSPSGELTRDDIINKVERALNVMPDKEKLIGKLNLFYGKKYYEIADILGVPRGTVSNYVKRVKEKLKKTLRDYSF